MLGTKSEEKSLGEDVMKKVFKNVAKTLKEKVRNKSLYKKLLVEERLKTKFKRESYYSLKLWKNLEQKV
jgi:3-hydroxyacyl-CoA dehydrogenase